MAPAAGAELSHEGPASDRTRWLNHAGLAAGPLLALLVYVLIPEAQFAPSGEIVSGLEHQGRVVAAVGVWMAVWWLSEALPVPATALLPLAAVPLLSAGEVSIQEAASPYANHLIFLYMGGFMLALAMQRHGLHRRLALATVAMVGERSRFMVLGFMLASGFLSMWISNTATVVMMLPIALSVIALVRQRLEEEGAAPVEGEPFRFAIALLLGMAYAASIGGTATLIGTPPNTLLASFAADRYRIDLAFGAWLPLGLAIAVAMLPLTWWLVCRLYRPEVERIPGGRQLVRRELDRLGPIGGPERIVLAVFVATAFLWMARSRLAAVEIGGERLFAGVSDSGIAMLAALVLFAWPLDLKRGDFVLRWRDARHLPWGILLLFGGGLSLAALVSLTGVDRFVGRGLAGLGEAPPMIFVMAVAAAVMGLTEMTSNTATTATFMPIVAAVAEGVGIEPMRLLVPMVLAASCAFMMPVATPPNAIVFGSGEITIPQMVRAGLWLNLAALVAVVVLSALIGPWVGLW